MKLKGVGESFKKYPDYESKGIKAHFNLDESGVLSLDRVRAGAPLCIIWENSLLFQKTMCLNLRAQNVSNLNATEVCLLVILING